MITKRNPRTIHLGGDVTIVNDVASSEALTPGHLVERFSNSSVPAYRKHATAAGDTPAAFALDQPELNQAYDDAYTAGDLVRVGIGHKGSTFYALIASGQNLAIGARLESAGNGTLRVLAAGKALAQTLEAVNNAAGPSNAYIRIEVI